MARQQGDSEVIEPDFIPNTGSEAGNLVAQGATLMRIENETMLAVAIQRPRNEDAVLKGAIKELQLVPEQAKRAYYSIPYRERQPNGGYKMVPIEGPSIKASMALARRWGNCTVTARTLQEDATGIDIAGIFIDLETNFRVERPMRVSRVVKRRGGGTYTLDPQRWLAAIQAGASKAARNATINGLPDYLVAAYLKQARTIAAGDPDSKADPKKIDKTLEAFKRYDVTLAMLEDYLELKRDQWMGDHLATLIGIGNALKDSQMTVAEAFELEPAAQATTAGPGGQAGGLTPEAVAAGQTTGQDNAKEAGSVPCSHPDVSPAALSALGASGIIVCKACGEELGNPEEAPPKETKAKQKRIGE